MMTAAEDELLDIAQLAKRWKIPAQQVKRKISQNALPIPIVRLGPRSPRFRLSDVAEYEKNEALAGAREHHRKE